MNLIIPSDKYIFYQIIFFVITLVAFIGFGIYGYKEGFNEIKSEFIFLIAIIAFAVVGYLVKRYYFSR